MDEYLRAKEQEARARMVFGRIVKMTASQQRSLTDWVTMKALLWPYLIFGPSAAEDIPADWQKRFYANRELPPSTHLWTGACSDEEMIMVHCIPSPEIDTRTGDPTGVIGYFFSLCIDRVIFQVAVMGAGGRQSASRSPCPTHSSRSGPLSMTRCSGRRSTP